MDTVIGNAYGNMDSNIGETVCNEQSANTIVKDMNPIVLSLQLQVCRRADWA